MTAAARRLYPNPGQRAAAPAKIGADFRRSPSPLAVFTARAEARALLWRCLEFDLHDAVDVLQHAAERDGLVAKLGQDRVQLILRDAFHQFRGCS